jgi:hypothetical protein
VQFYFIFLGSETLYKKQDEAQKIFLEDLILPTIKGVSLLKRHYLKKSFQPWLHVVESCMFSLCLMPHLKLRQHFIYGMSRGQHDQNFQGEIGVAIKS